MSPQSLTSYFAVVVVLVSVALQASPIGAADRFEVDMRTDVEYGTGGGEKLHMDIALPKGAPGPRPAIVFIHGGGWAAGHRKSNITSIQTVARDGYIGATISYRFAPKHVWPAQIEDCKCAVRYLRAKAKELDLDPQRIGAIGFSAGGHLSMLLGAMDKGDKLEGDGGHQDQSSKVQAVVSYFGPTDLTVEYPPASRDIVRKFIGGSLAEKREQHKAASPVTYVNGGDAPMLLLQGTRDDLVPHDQAFRMAEALTKAGVGGRVEILLGELHGWRGPELRRTIDVSTAFFEAQLGKKSVTTEAGK